MDADRSPSVDLSAIDMIIFNANAEGQSVLYESEIFKQPRGRK